MEKNLIPQDITCQSLLSRWLPAGRSQHFIRTHGWEIEKWGQSQQSVSRFTTINFPSVAAYRRFDPHGEWCVSFSRSRILKQCGPGGGIGGRIIYMAGKGYFLGGGFYSVSRTLISHFFERYFELPGAFRFTQAPFLSYHTALFPAH